ncbi:uncharacterized protein LOC118241029 [Electrophorus electricus]|uniref:uncharacterized protein LOC118241029 n=1 Tax=Electrophorus electricus TaxID=8005 RepID=UPI0015CFF127|nr:uncharacterized protein LOC118241029 [Electrophorus electricus]
MSGRKSKKSQKLASTRQSLNRKSNIGTQEKENYDGPPHSGNEDHECEKNKTDTLNEILPASLLLQAGGAATACTDQQNSSLEPSPYSQSQDCKDLLVPTEVASKKRKIGSTRKNNRGLKAAEQNEKEPRCRLEVSEENTEQHGVTEVVSVIEEGSKEEYGQPDLSDCSPSQFLKPERSTLQGEHLLLGSITHTEEAAENNMGHNLEITFQSQTMGLSCYDHDQSMKAALNQESISHSLDCRIVTPAESKLSHNDSLQMYNQMEMFSDQVKFLHNITDQKRKVDTAQTHLTGNEVEKNLSEELCPKKHFYEMANQYGIVFNEDSRNVENFQVSQDMQVIPSQSCTALNTMLEQSKLDFMCEVKGDKETKSTFISHDYSTEARGADTITTSLINEHQQQCSGTSENGFYSSIDGTKESHGTITLENISTTVETVDEDLVSSCLKHKGDTSKLTQDLESAYELKSTDCWEEKKECNNLCVVSDRVDSESNEVVEASYPTQPIQSDSIILPLEQEHQVGASLDKISYEIGFHCDSPDLEFKCHKDEQYDFSFARCLNGDSNLRENAEGRNLNKLNNDECCETKTEKKEVESNTMAFTSSSQLLISKICHTKKVSDVVDETTLIHAETLYEITNEELETSNKAHDVPYSDSQELPPELEMQSVEGDGVDLCSGSHRLPDNKLDQGTRLYAEVPFQSNHIIIDKDEMGGNYITNDKNHKLFEQIQSTENVYHSVLSRGKEEDSGDTTLAVDETFQLTKRYPGEVDILERTDISTEHGRLLVYGSVDCVSEDRVNHEKRAQTTGQIIKQADDFQLSLADELQRQGTCFEEGMRYESHGEHERQEAKIFQSLSPMVKDKIVESDAGLIGHDYGAPEKDNIPQKSVVCVEVTDVLMTNSAKQEDNKTSIILFVSKDEETEDIVSSNPEYEFLDTKNKAMEMNSKTYRGIDTASTILPDMEELQIHKTQNKSELEEITVQKDELVDEEKDGEPLSLLDNFLNISHNSKLEEFKASEWTEIVTVTKDADHISTSIGHMGIKEVEPNEIISQDEDRNLYEEEKDVSLTDRSNGELKDVTKECGKIDTQPVILLDVVHQSEPVVFVGVSQTEAPLESTKHRESMIDDKQDYELTSSNEQKMAPVIRDIQNDLTDHSSPHKTSMTVEDCESTENGSPKQVDDSPICATIEHIYEIQDSVITPVNKEITLEVLSDQVTQLPWDDKEKGKRGVEDEDGDVCQEEKNMPLADIYDLSRTTNEFSKDDKNEVKEEIKAGSTEYSTREDFTLVCSKQYMHSELFSQTNEQNVSTKTPPSTVLENSDSTENDRNRKENTEVRNTELCAKIQTKKKKRFGSTRRLQGEHQQGRERKERQWQKVEDTEGTEHDREERCSEEITNLEPTHHLFTEPHSVERKVSLDQSLTTEREEGELKDVTGECGKIDTPPVHLLDVVHQSEPVVFDGASQAKAPLESTKHGESVIDDEQDYEFTSSNEQKMAPVIRDIQNDFTDHASPQEASMTVEDCDSESTENGSSKQVDGSPICATIEHIYEIQDSVIMPVNKEITLEVLSDQVTQLPWDDNSDENHLLFTYRI